MNFIGKLLRKTFSAGLDYRYKIIQEEQDYFYIERTDAIDYKTIIFKRQITFFGNKNTLYEFDSPIISDKKEFEI